MTGSVKIGDKVRFINAKGGGIVRRFQSKNVVLVEEDDGFETPILISEVVVVQETDKYNFPIEDKKATKEEEITSNDIPQPIAEEYSWDENEETREGEELSIYLAYLPVDIKQLQTTDMELYLVNDSNYYLRFCIQAKSEEKFIVKYQDIIEPQTTLWLDKIVKESVNDYEEIKFQAFAYKRTAFVSKPVIDITLKINPVKFYKLHTFKETEFFDKPALLQTIIYRDVLDLNNTISAEKIQEAINTKEVKNEENRKTTHKKRDKNDIIELDLHINELLDNTNGMSRGDMLKYQLDEAEKLIKQHLNHKGQKIVLIHGKGEGILRAEIEKMIKHKFKKCEYRDASFQQYGFGATMVIIH
ncbi:MAG: DUF2027 domain-containing protein [Candidatus Aphodosoma sp.]|nr:DUF2027 domain-containing protein [Candidatus Aphodosoma sp.]